MNNLLVELKKQLTSIMELIDSYEISNDDVIVINSEEMNDLKWITKKNDHNYFEFKNSIRFSLYGGNASYYQYEKEIFDKLMNGTIKRIVLNKLKTEIDINGFVKNYKLEELEKTILRDNYNKIK